MLGKHFASSLPQDHMTSRALSCGLPGKQAVGLCTGLCVQKSNTTVALHVRQNL